MSAVREHPRTAASRPLEDPPSSRLTAAWAFISVLVLSLVAVVVVLAWPNRLRAEAPAADAGGEPALPRFRARTPSADAPSSGPRRRFAGTQRPDEEPEPARLPRSRRSGGSEMQFVPFGMHPDDLPGGARSRTSAKPATGSADEGTALREAEAFALEIEARAARRRQETEQAAALLEAEARQARERAEVEAAALEQRAAQVQEAAERAVSAGRAGESALDEARILADELMQRAENRRMDAEDAEAQALERARQMRLQAQQEEELSRREAQTLREEARAER